MDDRELLEMATPMARSQPSIPQGDPMNHTQSIPYDDTPTGHSYAAAWIALIGFFALDVLIAVQIGALNHFFG
ncbi:hypothetical protein DN824_21965 [Stutzerimonas nosocomialis]|nr:hypothetical protein DN824_21965 [Stutzerimonas nosocomialis]